MHFSTNFFRLKINFSHNIESILTMKFQSTPSKSITFNSLTCDSTSVRWDCVRVTRNVDSVFFFLSFVFDNIIICPIIVHTHIHTRATIYTCALYSYIASARLSLRMSVCVCVRVSKLQRCETVICAVDNNATIYVNCNKKWAVFNVSPLCIVTM